MTQTVESGVFFSRERMQKMRDVRVALMDDELSFDLAVIVGSVCLCQGCARICISQLHNMTLVPEGQSWACDHCEASHEAEGEVLNG